MYSRVLQMAPPLPLASLFGQTPHGQQVDVGSMLLWLGMAAAAIGTISVAVYFAHRAALRRRLNSHPGLFDALCKVHQLDRGQRTLLRQIVRVRNMRYPGQIFTEPGWMNPKTLPATLQDKRAELGNLYHKLFG